MRKTIIFFLLMLSLMGCKNSMKEAKAADVRARTRQANEIHEMNMAERKATTSVRLLMKDTFYYSLMIGGSSVLIGGSFALAWLLIGGSINIVQHQRIKQVSLDVQTCQYPILIYGNGRRAFNPNNGERLLLNQTSDVNLPRLEATTKVQLAGLLSQNNGIKVIGGDA